MTKFLVRREKIEKQSTSFKQRVGAQVLKKENKKSLQYLKQLTQDWRFHAGERIIRLNELGKTFSVHLVMRLYYKRELKH